MRQRCWGLKLENTIKLFHSPRAREKEKLGMGHLQGASLLANCSCPLYLKHCLLHIFLPKGWCSALRIFFFLQNTFRIVLKYFPNVFPHRVLTEFCNIKEINVPLEQLINTQTKHEVGVRAVLWLQGELPGTYNGQVQERWRGEGMLPRCALGAAGTPVGHGSDR